MTTEKILFVDDEQNLLDGIQRQLRREFSLTTALSGTEGIQCITDDGPFAVIVSDMRMPIMDGVTFLRKAQELTPDSVRIMLTGNADITTAVKAINEGRIFRFLSKPCPPAALRNALESALEQHRLVTAERELLEQTLHGCVRLLTELLSMVNPSAFGKASRIKRYVKRVALLAGDAGGINSSDMWEFELVAMLSQIGYLVLPPDLMKKLSDGQELTDSERDQLGSHPRIARDLLANVPRLEKIAEAIALQNLRFDGSNGAECAPQGADIPVGARILKVVIDFDASVSSGSTPMAAIATLRERQSWYDPFILEKLENLVGLESKYVVKKVSVAEIVPSMILAEDVLTLDDQLLISKGFDLTDSVIQRLRYFAESGRLRAQPICVLVPTGVDSIATPKPDARKVAVAG